MLRFKHPVEKTKKGYKSMGKKIITEEMKLHDEWYKRAKSMKPDEFPEFFREMTEDYVHDYGTVCHAMSAIGLAAMFAFNNSNGASGGITGFQAGFVMWNIIYHMNYESNKCGLRLQDMDNLLYPQYEYKFTTISKDTWDAVKKEAQNCLLDRGDAHPDVVAHWKSIVDGNIPFGLKIYGQVKL